MSCDAFSSHFKHVVVFSALKFLSLFQSIKFSIWANIISSFLWIVSLFYLKSSELWASRCFEFPEAPWVPISWVSLSLHFVSLVGSHFLDITDPHGRCSMSAYVKRVLTAILAAWLFPKPAHPETQAGPLCLLQSLRPLVPGPPLPEEQVAGVRGHQGRGSTGGAGSVSSSSASECGPEPQGMVSCCSTAGWRPRPPRRGLGRPPESGPVCGAGPWVTVGLSTQGCLSPHDICCQSAEHSPHLALPLLGGQYFSLSSAAQVGGLFGVTVKGPSFSSVPSVLALCYLIPEGLFRYFVWPMFSMCPRGPIAPHPLAPIVLV